MLEQWRRIDGYAQPAPWEDGFIYEPNIPIGDNLFLLLDSKFDFIDWDAAAIAVSHEILRALQHAPRHVKMDALCRALDLYTGPDEEDKFLACLVDGEEVWESYATEDPRFYFEEGTLDVDPQSGDALALQVLRSGPDHIVRVLAGATAGVVLQQNFGPEFIGLVRSPRVVPVRTSLARGLEFHPEGPEFMYWPSVEMLKALEADAHLCGHTLEEYW
jgi:hypothetical protein